MKNIFTLTFFLALAAANAQQITSTFDTDTEGWIVTGDATSANPNYMATGGNPGGYVSADDTAAGGVWVWSAPEKFLGNKSDSYGKSLSFDLKQSSLNSQFDDSDIIITGADMTISLDLSNNPGIDWTHYSVVLDETLPWKLGFITSSTLATAVQIQTVLSNISGLKIRGEYVSGSDTGGLDNVILETNNLAVDSHSSSQSGIYPNPATDTVYFRESISDLTLYDLQSKKINIKISENAMDISELPKGIYILKCTSEGKNIVQKIIKK